MEPLPRAVVIEPVALNRVRDVAKAVGPSVELGLVLADGVVVGWYRSAEAKPPFASLPPAMSTRPSERSVAVWPQRAVGIEPAGLKVPVIGS